MAVGRLSIALPHHLGAGQQKRQDINRIGWDIFLSKELLDGAKGFVGLVEHLLLRDVLIIVTLVELLD